MLSVFTTPRYQHNKTASQKLIAIFHTDAAHLSVPDLNHKERNEQWLNSAGTGRNCVSQSMFAVPPPGDAVSSWRSTLYFWLVDFRENHYNCCCHQRSYFKAQMHQRLNSAGDPPHITLGSLQRSPYRVAKFKGPTSTSKRREKKRRGGIKGEGL